MADKAQNPLFSKNIPPPPSPASPIIAPMVESKKAESGSVSYEPPPVRQPTRPSEREQATVELSLYLRPSQDDKLEDLRRAYKKQTGKKISANEVVRRLIDHATLESLI